MDMSIFKKVFLRAILLTILGGVLVNFLVGCSGGEGNHSCLRDWMADSGQIRILSTTAQVSALASEIGGSRVKAWTLIQGDLDPHSYELVKGDDEKFSRAHLIFYNGLGLEHGASLSSVLREREGTVAIGEKIASLYPEKILKRGHVIDPHLWMDISVWQLAIDPIVESLSQKDPDGASYYRERGDLLSQQMAKKHLEIRGLLHQIPTEKRYLLTSHDAFRYFTKGYLAEEGELNWSERFAAPEGLAPDGQLSPIDIQRAIDFLRQKKISVLFPESNVSRDSIKKIASAGKELGLEIRVCSETLYGDSMSGLSYLEMMQANADVVSRYLE